MLNQVQIIGRLGQDPEVREVQGNLVANFSIATTEKWKDKNSGEPMEHTEWHRVAVWGRLAEIVEQYVFKGSLIYISGKLKTSKYTDANGVEKYSTTIDADTMKMLDGRPGGQGEQGGQQGNQQRQAPQQGQQRQPQGGQQRQPQGGGQQRQQPQNNQQSNRQAPPQRSNQTNNQSRQQPQRQAAPAGGGGFDDMDDDIPF